MGRLVAPGTPFRFEDEAVKVCGNCGRRNVVFKKGETITVPEEHERFFYECACGSTTQFRFAAWHEGPAN